MKQNFGNDNLAYIEFESIEAETDMAILFKVDGEDVWIPKSQLEDQGEELFAIPKWLADKKGLESSYE